MYRGADINHLIHTIERVESLPIRMQCFTQAAINLAMEISSKQLKKHYDYLLYLVRDKTGANTSIMVSSIPPRYGFDVKHLNEMLKYLCEVYNLECIDHQHTIHDKIGHLRYQLFHKDGIHLSRRRTSAFLWNIHEYVDIMKHDKQSNWCKVC